MTLNEELKQRWKRYVESYNEDTSKRMHLISATHVVNRIIDTATLTNKPKSKFPEYLEHRCKDKDCKICKKFSS